MTINSKVKGNGFERTIANRLSQRFQDATGLTQSFRRATDSGSYFGRSNARRLLATGSENATFGDILTPSNFRFCIEAKSYSTPPSFGHLIKQSCPMLDKWIDQVSADAANANKVPAIIAKFNHCPTFVILPEGFNIEPIISYRGWDIIALDTWLTLPDDHFFSE